MHKYTMQFKFQNHLISIFRIKIIKIRIRILNLDLCVRGCTNK